LRDAILGQSTRQVEVTKDGTIQEAHENERQSDRDDDLDQPRKPTKLAARTFGVHH